LGLDFVHGSCAAFDINITMTQYIMPMARNSRTGETIKEMDLTGGRYQMHQRRECLITAQRLAAQLTARTGDAWTAVIQPYTPTQLK
jgi:hypothetical protein